MTLQQAYQQTLSKLSEIYNEREAANIADLVVEHLSGEKKIDRFLNKKKLMSIDQERLLSDYTERLLQQEPIQYVLHEAWFAGMKFYVDENVLIPRPETEELVEWVVTTHNSQLTTHHSPFTILDIGTGSGCIAIALKKKLPFADVHALDVSEAVLNIALRNAHSNIAQVNFFKADILRNDEIRDVPGFDIIVSNPPYVKRSEAEEMRTNVFLYEPHSALFVPDENPLLFYDHIANFSLHCMKPGGILYLEINEMLGCAIEALLLSKDFTSIQIKKDMQGKDRMIKAKKGT